MTDEPAVVPELGVTDLDQSLSFWCDLIGFEVKYDRIDEGFAYITLGDAHFMLDRLETGRSWLTGEASYPLGQGINFEISVRDLQPILSRLAAVNWPLFLKPEEKWYGANEVEIGVQQFLVQDPDGYLLRPQVGLGTRPRRELSSETDQRWTHGN